MENGLFCYIIVLYHTLIFPFACTFVPETHDEKILNIQLIIMKDILFFVSVLFLFGCTSSSEKAAWNIAENCSINKKELVDFLTYYKENGDNEKYRAACYLVENMPNKFSVSGSGPIRTYDIDIVKSDSLIQSLEYSFRLKEETPYLKNYTFEQFCEYILPYRIANEPLQYYWKWDCVKYYGDGDSDDMITAARNINARVKLSQSPEFYKDPLKSYATLMQDGYGKCDDRSTLVVMALRSAGIPASFEFVPYWGSSNNAHSFGSVILPNADVISFQNDDENSENGLPIRKMPKIYRKVYTIYPKQSSASTALGYPEPFANCDILDVSSIHHINSREVIVNVKKDQTTYLSVFSPTEWIPVAISTDGVFQNMGTGTQKGQEESEEAFELGDGILYLPSVYINDEIASISFPIIVSDDSIRQLCPDTLHHETVTLTRKYPLNKRIVGFAQSMIGGVFEGANRTDFSDAEELYKIAGTPESKMQKVKISTDKNYRYIRYRKPKGTFSIAEFSLCQPDGTPLSFHPIACEAIHEDSTMTTIFDNNPLTYYQVSGGIDLWIGADMHRATKVGAIVFTPRNDDNSVVPTDNYELLYWNNKWSSLGQKISTGDAVVYNNVPKKALLWLRNLTKGREERPFTYENGRQIWW